VVRYTVDGHGYTEVGQKQDHVPFRVGERVMVTYDPADPSRSYLPQVDESPTKDHATALSAISMLFAVFFGWLWWYSRHQERKQRRAREREVAVNDATTT